MHGPTCIFWATLTPFSAAAAGAAACGDQPAAHPGGAARMEGKIHRVDPDFGSTLTASNGNSQSNCWVNLKIVGQPCEFQVRGLNACQLSFLAGVCESHHGLNARLRGLWAPDSSLQQWVAMQRAMAANAPAMAAASRLPSGQWRARACGGRRGREGAEPRK
jgi:hypothetical protein